MPLVPQERRPSRARKWVLIGAAVMAVVIFTFSLAAFLARDTTSAHIVCSSSVLRQARAQFDPKDVAKLKAVVQNIQTMKNYQRDPNCMYAVTYYYINANDVTKAQSSLDTLDRIHPKTATFSPDVQYLNRGRAFFVTNIAYLQRTKTQTQANTRGIE